MITIQSIMLVALGFLLATLLAFALAPAYWARAVRLTYRHIRQSMPVTLEEIQADKDRMRALYAIRIHDLESRLEKARLTAARQQVEVNRRDASISALEAELTNLRTELEQNVNARRVLEQTVMDRLPSVEQRLADTRNLLEQRDRELSAVNAETGKTVRALDEVMQINAQQRAEIERLNAVVATRAARNRGSLKDSRFDGEVALRSELEALRAKSRDQEALIARLKAIVSPPASKEQTSDEIIHVNGSELTVEDVDIGQVKRDLDAVEETLRSASAAAEGVTPPLQEDPQIETLKRTIAEQSASIRRLEASLAAYQDTGTATRSISLRDSKIAMKARIAALQSELDTQGETIQRLKAELASANERLAVQSAQFMEEMRRLGSGGPSSQSRRAASTGRRTLSERIGEAKPALANSIRTIARLNSDRTSGPAEDNAEPERRSSAAADKEAEAGNPRENAAQAGDVPKPVSLHPEIPTASPASGAPETRQKLLDRIAALGKS